MQSTAFESNIPYNSHVIKFSALISDRLPRERFGHKTFNKVVIQARAGGAVAHLPRRWWGEVHGTGKCPYGGDGKCIMPASTEHCNIPSLML